MKTDHRRLLGSVSLILALGCSWFADIKVSCAAPGGICVAKPTPEQVEYLDMELQMFVCLDPCTWQNREYDNHSTPLTAINPARLDTDQWCRVAQSFGAKQILFVAKHTGGFCWWRTKTSDYGIRNTPYKSGKGDVLAQLSRSCRKHGLKLGIYVYPGDDLWGAGIGSGGRTSDPKKQEAYNKVFRQQLIEVLSRYGTVAEVWFDGSCVIEVGDILKKHAPRAMVFQGPHTTLRWVGNEAGAAPYPTWQTVKRADAAKGIATAAQSDPDGDVWLPLECDTTLLDHKWFWGRNTDHMLKSLDQLMDVYYKSVGRGCLLLLNSTPDTTGLIPDSHVRRYREFGHEIARRFDQCIAEMHGKGNSILLDLGRPTVINHAITMEDVREGQRVRAYRLEGRTRDGWKTLVSRGQSIGHKRIDQFSDTEVSQVRLVISQSAAEPLILRLAVFQVDDDGNTSRIATPGKLRQTNWIRAGSWEPGAFAPTLRSLDIDITRGVPKPGDYEVRFEVTDSESTVEVKSVELVIAGRVIRGRTSRLPDSHAFSLYRMEQTTADSPTAIRIEARTLESKPCKGVVLVRPR